jgi:hypothetical protein
MKMLAALSFLCLFATSSALATVVDWRLDPNGTAGTADSARHAFLSSISSITGNGHAVEWQSHIPLGQYREFGQTAPGSAGLADHQWRENGYFSTQSVQLEVNSIFPQGATDEKLQLGSVHGTSNDAFATLGSSTLSDSGEQTEEISVPPSDMVFASIANLTKDKLASTGSVSGTLMTAAFQATLTPVPEIGALFPIIGLVAAVVITQFLRRRRIAQVRAASLDAN